MVVKLGTFGEDREYKTLSWKEFKKSEHFPAFKEAVKKLINSEGAWRTPIERILKGGKYPSIALVWTAIETPKEVIRVKLSVQKQNFAEVLRALGVKKLTERGSALDFVLFKDDNGKISYGVDKSTLPDTYGYVDKGTYYALEDLSASSEDEEFNF